MVEFASLEVFLSAVALLAIIFAIFWAVRCAVGRRRTEAKEVTDGGGKREGLLNKEVVADVPSGQTAEPKRDEPLCAICKARLADGGQSRRLRPCGHVYHAECINLWLERKSTCPLCRAGVDKHRRRDGVSRARPF